MAIVAILLTKLAAIMSIIKQRSRRLFGWFLLVVVIVVESVIILQQHVRVRSLERALHAMKLNSEGTDIDLPAQKDFETVTIAIDFWPRQNLNEPEPAPVSLKLAPHRWGALIDLVSHGRPYPSATDRQIFMGSSMGRVDIITTTGSHHVVRLFHAGGDTLQFSVNGSYYLNENRFRLASLVDACLKDHE